MRVTRAAICGSDLHLYHGMMPDTRLGHTFGHEFIGVVDEVGSSVEHLQVGELPDFQGAKVLRETNRVRPEIRGRPQRVVRRQPTRLYRPQFPMVAEPLELTVGADADLRA